MIDDFILDMQRVFSITNHNYSYFTRLIEEHYRSDSVMKDVFKHVLRIREGFHLPTIGFKDRWKLSSA